MSDADDELVGHGSGSGAPSGKGGGGSKGKKSKKRVVAAKPANSGSFHQQVMAAAHKVPEQMLWGGKALIHHVHAEFAKTPAGRGVSLETFKERIANDATVRGHMSRHDMTGHGFEVHETQRASTRYMNAEWHTIRVKDPYGKKS